VGKWLARFAEKNISQAFRVGTDKTDIGSSLAALHTPAHILKGGTTQARNLKTPTLPKEQEQTNSVASKVVQLYRIRDTCQAAGHCLGLTQERDCNLYPLCNFAESLSQPFAQ